jgi:hypothetical protein
VFKLKALVMLAIALLPALLRGAKCSPNGQSVASEGWSKQIRRVCLTQDVEANSFPSPDKTKVIAADASGFHLRLDGKRVPWQEGDQMMALGSDVSWSPQSSALFISYADGSGLDGWTLKVYTVSHRKVVRKSDINQEIIRRFRADVDCPGVASDPNVRGLGWSENGADIYAFAQATVGQSCGQQGDFRGVVMSIAKGSVLRFYSEAETKARFHNLLPYNMR